MHKLDYPISWEEFGRAVNKLKNGKAPGLSGVSSEAFKAMDDDYKRYRYDFICKFWDDRADFESLHRSQCVSVCQNQVT